MIKSNEVRIGNYILFEPISDLGYEIIKVQELPFKDKNNSKGIILTKEWLIRFGFEDVYRSKYRLKFDHSNHYEIGYDFSRTEDKSMEGFRYYGNYIKIKYVHQLQNLYFALTGHELKYTQEGGI